MYIRTTSTTLNAQRTCSRGSCRSCRFTKLIFTMLLTFYLCTCNGKTLFSLPRNYLVVLFYAIEFDICLGCVIMEVAIVDY